MGKAKAKKSTTAKKPAKTKTRTRTKAKARSKPASKSTLKSAAKSKAKAKAKSKPKAKPVRERTFASIDDLSRAWNDEGRAYLTEYSARLAKFYGDNDREVDLDMTDPRTKGMGDQVMRAVIDLNARGEAQRARELFDPAYSPVFPWIEKNDRDLGFVAILGPDELLVHRGAAWQDDGVTFHLAGDRATPIADIDGMCRSRNRDYLVLARTAGLEIRDARAGVAAFSGPPIASIPWPPLTIFPDADEAKRFKVEQLEISDDGMRVVVSCYRQGILLASRHPGERPWTLLWPVATPPYYEREDEDDSPRAGDMTHVAISRDGTRLAFGCQDRGHFLAEVDAAGTPQWYATVGYLSEYPHHACFSDDGRHVALNSCHFYNGATIAFDWNGNRGVDLASYEQHQQAPCIDGTLRVYAARWIDKPVLDAIVHYPAKSDGAFVLAGSGIMRITTPTGGLAAVQGFGSSAGAIDFCPESRRFAMTAYSGFVHVYDPYVDELPGRIDGFRPRRELTRWALWEHLPSGPVRW